MGRKRPKSMIRFQLQCECIECKWVCECIPKKILQRVFFSFNVWRLMFALFLPFFISLRNPQWNCFVSAICGNFAFVAAIHLFSRQGFSSQSPVFLFFLHSFAMYRTSLIVCALIVYTTVLRQHYGSNKFEVAFFSCWHCRQRVTFLFAIFSSLYLCAKKHS